MINNLLLHTDVYKMGHMDQYPPGTTEVYSYLTARSGAKIPKTLFFGLQYYLTAYLQQAITTDDVDQFMGYKRSILGSEGDSRAKLMSLVKLGYMPLEIRAVPEGTVLPTGNVLMTVRNTHPDFAWVVGFFESLLLKVWNTTTVASYSYALKQIMSGYAHLYCDNQEHLQFQVHDFGYRGCSSEETAALSGAAHLINFLGTDTVPGLWLLRKYYAGGTDGGPIGLSVPATEHSVMCAYKRENEFDAFDRMINVLYPEGFVSIVSDTYNLWTVLTDFAPRLKDQIMARRGRVVFRPDSGDPVKVVCGDPDAAPGSPEFKGALQLLDEVFGSTLNSKNMRVLDPHVGLIYGDGMTSERMQEMITKAAAKGYAPSNLVFGVGGLLLQQHSRDTQGFAIKATHCIVNGEQRAIMKDPVTDSGKRSLCGYLALRKDEQGQFVTQEVPSLEEANNCSLLELVFKDGQLLRFQTLSDIRDRAQLV